MNKAAEREVNEPAVPVRCPVEGARGWVNGRTAEIDAAAVAGREECPPPQTAHHRPGGP
jgi:hypothetical protein